MSGRKIVITTAGGGGANRIASRDGGGHVGPIRRGGLDSRGPRGDDGSHRRGRRDGGWRRGPIARPARAEQPGIGDLDKQMEAYMNGEAGGAEAEALAQDEAAAPAQAKPRKGNGKEAVAKKTQAELDAELDAFLAAGKA